MRKVKMLSMFVMTVNVRARRKVLAVTSLAVILATLFSTTQTWAAPATPPQPNGFYQTVTAYKLDVAYWTGLEPHYGAFFSGSYGYNQHYLGPGGDSRTCSSSAGCISGWNWWGDYLNVLLVPKGDWLWCCGGPSEAWTASNYQATMWID